ncbi:response regulator [Sphingomonas hengshuiensis]|uniref:histidine kinase n=1 Tax=Sphingomonas hengshuiensis TaxID=1609977 RepID=A0A7U4J7U5_9SPHN|nr:response regulator [Sphingomonas hengshuiensis]AJP71737.1 histidine kinase [Sphingomonas hengshuiensis]
MQSLLGAFWNGNYAPHGYCLLWHPGLVWTHVLADSIIAMAYFSIPLALVSLVRRRPDLEFGWVFWSFAIFILACGCTHLMAIWTLWQPVYGLEAMVKVVTAIASIVTAVLLWPLLPKAIALPSPGRLQAANAELAALIAERDAALAELRGQIDQRKQAEAALLQSQKLEAVGQLTGGIAHDFNNLLQAVAGNLELIARKPGDADRVVRWSASALDAVERGRSLTGQLLAFSRHQRLDMTSVRIGELVSGMRDLVERAVAPLSQVQVRPIDPSWNVEVDPLQLELVILNLAFNARDAMPNGGILTVSAERHSGPVAPDLPAGDYVVLTVADTGIGMDEETMARAVEPFFTTKGVGKGTGMGLAMAFGVMRQSGGALEIDSAPGRGTTVKLYLRLATAEPPRAVPYDDAADQRIDLTGRRIVLVDDDTHVRATLAEILAQAGAVVIEAASGAEGIDMVRRERPELLVIDFAMPGMNGAEVAELLRSERIRVPVLVVTGFATSASLDAIAGPHVDVLKKPFESQQFLRRVRDLLGR